MSDQASAMYVYRIRALVGSGQQGKRIAHAVPQGHDVAVCGVSTDGFMGWSEPEWDEKELSCNACIEAVKAKGTRKLD